MEISNDVKGLDSFIIYIIMNKEDDSEKKEIIEDRVKMN